MAVTPTITSQDAIGRVVEVRGTLAFSGNYVTGGEVPTFAGVRSSSVTPTQLWAEGIAGYKYEWNPANGKILVRQGAGAINLPLAELSAAAYPAGVTGDTIRFVAEFKKP